MTVSQMRLTFSDAFCWVFDLKSHNDRTMGLATATRPCSTAINGIRARAGVGPASHAVPISDNALSSRRRARISHRRRSRLPLARNPRDDRAAIAGAIVGGEVMAKKAKPRGVNSVDQHIAARIRAKREELGLSQTVVADAIGITFQQVQKYEYAANRVSAGRLWQIASYFKVPITYFFEGLRQA